MGSAFVSFAPILAIGRVDVLADAQRLLLLRIVHSDVGVHPRRRSVRVFVPRGSLEVAGMVGAKIMMQGNENKLGLCGIDVATRHARKGLVLAPADGHPLAIGPCLIRACQVGSVRLQLAFANVCEGLRDHVVAVFSLVLTGRRKLQVRKNLIGPPLEEEHVPHEHKVRVDRGVDDGAFVEGHGRRGPVPARLELVTGERVERARVPRDGIDVDSDVVRLSAGPALHRQRPQLDAHHPHRPDAISVEGRLRRRVHPRLQVRLPQWAHVSVGHEQEEHVATRDVGIALRKLFEVAIDAALCAEALLLAVNVESVGRVVARRVEMVVVL
eukprot:976683-Prymnesium_polylepis.1